MDIQTSNFIKNLLPSVSNKNLISVLKKATLRKFKKGDVLFKEGQIPKSFYIVKTGIIRGFVIDKNGKERINRLYFSPNTCGPLSELIQQIPTESIHDCLTNCELVEFDYLGLKELANNDLQISLLNVATLERSFIRSYQRTNDLTILDATERYLKLKKTVPNIDNLIQQYHIASYLNITPVQLSRIRKKLYSK